jgi:hypothetical protein
VDEPTWLACTDLCMMLAFLNEGPGGRKLRLFACACCRGVWHLLTDERSRDAVETAEQYADSLAGEAGLLAAHEAAACAYQTARTPASRASGCSAAACSAAELFPADSPGSVVVEAADAAAQALAFAADGVIWSTAWYDALNTAKATQSAVLRDLISNPFRPKPALDPAWLAWGRATIPSLATAIYEERRWEDLPVLADALEEAGCTNAEVLSHCRGPGPHARGCWLVDALLGKE